MGLSCLHPACARAVRLLRVASGSELKGANHREAHREHEGGCGKAQPPQREGPRAVDAAMTCWTRSAVIGCWCAQNPGLQDVGAEEVHVARTSVGVGAQWPGGPPG